MSRKKHAKGGYAVLLQEAQDRLERARKRLAANPEDEYAQKEVRIVEADVARLKKLAKDEAAHG